MALVDRRNRPPIVNRLYGGRLRITYRSDVINSVDTKAELLASVLLEPKTADSKHTECLIVSQDLAGGELNKPNTLIQVFETLTTAMVDEIQPITDTDVNARESITRTLIGQPDVDISAISIGSIYNSSYAATQIVNQSDEFRRQLKVKYLEVELSETQIGGDQRIDTENGRTAFVRTFVQLSAATYVPGDVGDISTIDSLSVALSDIKSETSGAVRTISRTYITAGKLSESTKDSSNGKLIVKSLVFFNEIPSTPSGFTLTDTSVKNPDGSPTYSYQFAKGVGRISTKESTRQKGQVKITSIQYLGADDATTPSGNLIDSDVTEKDGYVLTSQAYAEIVGTGYLVNDVQTKEGGKLVIYNQVRVGSLPATPTQTIGGSVVLIDESTREEDGYTVYNRKWAEGNGQVSQVDQTRRGGAILIRRIRHIVALAASNPISTPADYTAIRADYQDQDGIRIWTAEFVKGTGLISSVTRDGKIPGTKVVTNTAFGAANVPSGVLIGSEDREDDGYIVYVRTAIQGTLVEEKYTYTDLVNVTIPGTVNLTTESVPDGTVAIAEVVPPSSKQVLATVTVEIVTTPPTAGTAAYDIGQISCAVTFIRTEELYVGTQVIGAGTANTISTEIYRTLSSVRQAEYRGCYLSGGGSATGTQEYDTTDSESDTYTNTITTKAKGTGATSNTSSQYGILRRNVRPVLTALDGTNYFEVVTWELIEP